MALLVLAACGAPSKHGPSSTFDIVLGGEDGGRWESAAPSVVVLVDGADSIEDLSEQGQQFELPAELGTRGIRADDLHVSAVEKGSRGFSMVELECTEGKCVVGSGSEVALASDIDFDRLRMMRSTQTSIGSNQIDYYEAPSRTPISVVGRVAKRLRACMGEDSVDIQSEDRLLVQVNIDHPDGFVHLLRANIQIYFSGMSDGIVDMPPRATGWITSWKQYDAVPGLVVGYPSNQLDVKKFRTGIQQCLAELWQ